MSVTEDSEMSEGQAEECRARASWYRLLAGAFVEEPSRDYLAAVRDAECRQALDEVGVQWDSDFLDTDLDTLEEDLACEYTMLFASAGAFPHVESVRMDGGYRLAAFDAVQSIYSREGFEVAPRRFLVFEDQLGVELAFLAEMLERRANALEEGDDQEARRLQGVIEAFWTNHLGRWVRGYCRLLSEEAAQHSFYREMARLLERFAKEELALMGLSVTDEDGAHLRPNQPGSSEEEALESTRGG